MKTQIWIAISVYVLVAIIKKRLQVPGSLYSILQILSVTLFEKIQLSQVLTESHESLVPKGDRNQLSLFKFKWDSTVMP